MSFIKALAHEKQRSLNIKQAPSFQINDLKFPYLSRIKTQFTDQQISIVAVEPINTGEIIACIPFVLIPNDINTVSYKDSSAVTHKFKIDRLNYFNDHYALFEFDMLFTRYACFYSANCFTNYKLLNQDTLVLVSTATKPIAEGEVISLDLGSYYYESEHLRLQCNCGHESCPQITTGFKSYPQEYKNKVIQKKRIDLACAAEYYAEQFNSKVAKDLIELHYLTQLHGEEETAFYYFYDQYFNE